MDNQDGDWVLEIADDGIGMSHDIIENVWCVIGTPYRKENPYSEKGGRIRRASGEKGLGRLGAMRLGKQLEIITQQKNEKLWQMLIDWDQAVAASSWDSIEIDLRSKRGESAFRESGTILRIHKLREDWVGDGKSEKEKIRELEEQLKKLVPPFQDKEDFEIWFTGPGMKSKSFKIEPSEFLLYPPYYIQGKVDDSGVCNYTYRFANGKREREITSKKQLTMPKPDMVFASCGPFNFEFKVWDLESESILELDKRFNLGGKVSEIRKSISGNLFSGISLYRDKILVLPKSESNRDWLGLRPLRISRVGTRIDEKQMHGFVEISAERNVDLIDTSDRERLVENPASTLFRKRILKIIELLQNEREKDRFEPEHEEPPLKDILDDIRTYNIIDQFEKLPEGEPKKTYIQIAAEEKTKLDKTVDEIEKRFYYYSKLATLGTIAAFLQHEVGNNASVVDSFINHMRKLIERDSGLPSDTKDRLNLAGKAISRLKGLAERFAPLASRRKSTRKKTSTLEHIITDCQHFRSVEIKRCRVQLLIPESKTEVAVDPGELTAIILNLLDNSLYWLLKHRPDRPLIKLDIFRKDSDQKRITVRVHDNGPGIEEGEEERIFWPGITKKPEGLGMGLTVASELVAQSGGRMSLMKPSELGGASFEFDLPLKE